MKLTTVPIVFGINYAYLKPMCVTISSILRHAGATDENGMPREFYVFIDEIDLCSERVVIEIFKSLGAVVHFIKLPVLNAEFGHKRHISPHTYYRYYIPKVLGDFYERAIYLDADIIVRGDIYSIFDYMKPTDGLGVWCENVPLHVLQRDGRDKLPIPLKNYFNAGVMAFNFENLPDGFLEKCQSYTEPHYVFGDQDALNVMVVKENLRVGFVPETYNTFHSHGYNPAIVLHFVGGMKPWKVPAKSDLFGMWHEEKDKFLELMSLNAAKTLKAMMDF